MWLAEHSHWPRAAGCLAEGWCVPAAGLVCAEGAEHATRLRCAQTPWTPPPLRWKGQAPEIRNNRGKCVTQMAHALHNSCHFSSSSLQLGTEDPRHYPLRFTHISLFSWIKTGRGNEEGTPNLAILNTPYFGGGVIAGSIHYTNTTPPRKAVGRKLWSPADHYSGDRKEQNKKKNMENKKCDAWVGNQRFYIHSLPHIIACCISLGSAPAGCNQIMNSPKK